MSQSVDPVRLTADLVRCPSVTPEEAGTFAILVPILEAAGFECHRCDRGGVPNLYARKGPKGAARTLAFGGHVDVVPVGDEADWSVDPFSAEIRDGVLYGRGATDMKSGVAAFVAAAVEAGQDLQPGTALSLLITGDEEGPGRDGTLAILDWMEKAGERMTACIVAEPSCPEIMGEMIKIGRRGSLNLVFTVKGVQGHVAYPHRAKNPVDGAAELAHRLATLRLDEGSDHFDPSTLALTGIDTGNLATNVIPGATTVRANIRFNDLHSGASLIERMRGIGDEVAEAHGLQITLDARISGESFFTPPGELSDLVARIVADETKVIPVLSTGGGTSDARFIRAHCPVVEFGLVGLTMHQTDERVEIQQIETLARVFTRIAKEFVS
ncbi:succinyl-diaminopimelate desuccinylase [Tropicimonas sp. IMCC34011]|uniref:succinyl-diaminopimelate desuccinylase n=1 Tax=Tropicimonas sp. IMCC34011 TaxID=2248759 RepID=UPI000E22218E|nr:succinyl-diaminopimelate desuccinylase [Tropicimonas sp. IMCC34011]